MAAIESRHRRARWAKAVAISALASLLVGGCQRLFPRPDPAPVVIEVEAPLDADAVYEGAFHALVLGQHQAAKKGFSSLIERAETGEPRVPDALFWRAYLAELEEDSAAAAEQYAKLAEQLPGSPYAPLARERLQALAPDGSDDAENQP